MNVMDALRNIVVQQHSLDTIKDAVMDVIISLAKSEAVAPYNIAPVTANRFAINVPAESRWDSYKQEQIEQPARVVYFIDGAAYMSKIISIKVIRERDGIGLRDAKDIVDRLEATAINAKARF